MPAADARPPAGNVVVALETACLCGSDIPFFSESHDRYPLPVGLSLHEIVGRLSTAPSPDFRAGRTRARHAARPSGTV